MRAFISKGGPDRKIQVDGVLYEFEMHRYCGPNILKRNGEPLKKQPFKFLYAASLWAQQGAVIDADGMCVWQHKLRNTATHIGGKNYLITGQEPVRKGE